MTKSASLVEQDVDAAVAPAFFLDLADTHHADFGRGPQVCTTAGLQVHPFDFQQPYPAGAFRRLNGHRPYQLGLGLEFLVADPAAADRVVGRYQRPQFLRNLLLVDGIFHVEIEAALRGRNIAAGNAVLEDRTEQMHRRMHAHVKVTPVPVDGGADPGADRWKFGTFFREMADRAAIAVACVDDRHRSAVPFDRAGIPGLTAAHRVEDGPVEFDPAVARRRDRRLAILEVGIIAKKLFGHLELHWRTPNVLYNRAIDIRSSTTRYMSDIPSFGRAPKGRHFIKMHGLENHFVIVDGRHDAWQPGAEEVVRICNPKTGVGGDQLIIVERPRDAGAVAFMRIFNIDGREAEACGNATRCVAWLLLEEASEEQITLETVAGLIDCRRSGDLEVSCTMGRVSTDWRDIPLSRELDTCHVGVDFDGMTDGIALNIGNPHIVFFVDDVDAVDIETIAPSIQQHELFPNQVNVGIAQLVDSRRIRSKVYERGAGLTRACGSGACVAAYAALVRGLTDERKITVSMPAGEVTIEVGNDGVATMTGPVAFCFSGHL